MNEDNILDIEQFVSDDNSISESTEVDSSVSIENTENEQISEETTTETGETESDPQTEQSEGEGSDGVETVTEVVVPEYTTENPLPVTLVEEVPAQEELEVFALSGTYYGTISDTYLDYFEGIVQKLTPNEHYVIWRSGQYAYNMCYGENITLDGTYFSGDCELVQIYRSSDSYSSDWYVFTGSDSLALSATDIFCYSDLGMYPTVERGLSSAEGMALLFAVCVATVFMLAHSIYDYIVKHIYRK